MGTASEARANVGDGLQAQAGNWKFGGSVAESFDSHVSKSVPMYNEGHELVCDLSDFFVKDESLVYEIGCSTGTLMLKLASHNGAKAAARFVGIDTEKDMVNKARQKAIEQGVSNACFEIADATEYELEKCDLIICYYTLQFVPPAKRQELVDRIYRQLNWGGALLVFEKVRGSDARFQDIFTTLYNDYKLRRGYTPEEIISKSRSLKGVLEPFSTQANIDVLHRAGFEDINTIMKYLCFEGFLAIK